jgi:hypothetical protein
MKLSKELANQAKRFNICQEWHDELKTLEDKKAMLEMYLKGIDFCLSNDYPTNEFIRANFKGMMEQFGVFLDDSIDLVNVEKCVALGQTKGCVETNNFGCSQIFVKHHSELTIIAKGDSFVMVDLFDNAVIHIQAHDRAKVCVNRYGDSRIDHKETDSGMVKIIEKHKKTY